MSDKTETEGIEGLGLQEALSVWSSTPAAMKEYVFWTIRQQIAELERSAARGKVATAMTAVQMTKTMGQMEQSLGQVDGKISAAMTAAGLSIASGPSPEEVLADHLGLALEILQILADIDVDVALAPRE